MFHQRRDCWPKFKDQTPATCHAQRPAKPGCGTGMDAMDTFNFEV
jgi:hypothetical protein